MQPLFWTKTGASERAEQRKIPRSSMTWRFFAGNLSVKHSIWSEIAFVSNRFGSKTRSEETGVRVKGMRTDKLVRSHTRAVALYACFANGIHTLAPEWVPEYSGMTIGLYNDGCVKHYIEKMSTHGICDFTQNSLYHLKKRLEALLRASFTLLFYQ